MSVCCKCWVLSGGGLCDEPITRPEEPYRVWCVYVSVIECDQVQRSPCAPRMNRQTEVRLIKNKDDI